MLDKATYMKEYYEKNKNKLEEEIICEECGHKYKRCKKSAHIKTRKHLLKILENENKNIKNETKEEFKLKIGEEEYMKEKKEEIMEKTKKEIMEKTKNMIMKEIKKIL